MADVWRPLRAARAGCARRRCRRRGSGWHPRRRSWRRSRAWRRPPALRTLLGQTRCSGEQPRRCCCRRCLDQLLSHVQAPARSMHRHVSVRGCCSSQHSPCHPAPALQVSGHRLPRPCRRWPRRGDAGGHCARWDCKGDGAGGKKGGSLAAVWCSCPPDALLTLGCLLLPLPPSPIPAVRLAAAGLDFCNHASPSPCYWTVAAAAALKQPKQPGPGKGGAGASPNAVSLVCPRRALPQPGQEVGVCGVDPDPLSPVTTMQDLQPCAAACNSGVGSASTWGRGAEGCAPVMPSPPPPSR